MRLLLSILALFAVLPGLGAQIPSGAYVCLIGGRGDGGFAHRGLLSLNLTAAESVTGKIRLGGLAAPFRGHLQDGHYQGRARAAGHETLSIDFQIDSGGTLQGYVSTGTGSLMPIRTTKGTYSAAAPAAPASRYTVVIFATAAPTPIGAGYGYATMKVGATGGVVLTGKMGDGRHISLGSRVDGERKFPFYACLSAYFSENLAGTIVFERGVALQTDFDGELSWTPFRGDTPAMAYGSVYVPSAPGERVLGLEEATFTATPTFLPFGYFTNFTISKNNKITPGLPDLRLAMKFDTATGLFSGHFGGPSHSTLERFGGVLFQDHTAAYGSFGTGGDVIGIVKFKGR